MVMPAAYTASFSKADDKFSRPVHIKSVGVTAVILTDLVQWNYLYHIIVKVKLNRFVHGIRLYGGTCKTNKNIFPAFVPVSLRLEFALRYELT